MKIRFDREEGIYLIPTVVIKRKNVKYLKTTLVKCIWLNRSISFVSEKVMLQSLVDIVKRKIAEGNKFND